MTHPKYFRFPGDIGNKVRGINEVVKKISPILDIENEVDRYIAWPGQALAYKIGQLKILELRSKAEKELGEKYDIKDFHDEVLKRGSLPLDLLEYYIDEWINQTLNS